MPKALVITVAMERAVKFNKRSQEKNVYQYIRDPEEIYRRSFETIRLETDLSLLPLWLRPIAVRLVHACGMPDIVKDLAWGGKPSDATQQALSNGG